MDDLSVFLEDVHLFEAVKRLHADLLQYSAQLLVVWN